MGNRDVARSRVKGPGIALLLAGIFGFFGTAIFGFYAVVLTQMPSEVIDQMDEQQLEQIRQLGDPVEVIKNYGIGAMVGLGLSVIANLIMILGGIQMMRMKSYGLSMFASIIGLIPCAATCCFIAIPAGIWGIATLMNSDVKQGFK